VDVFIGTQRIYSSREVVHELQRIVPFIYTCSELEFSSAISWCVVNEPSFAGAEAAYSGYLLLFTASRQSNRCYRATFV